MTPTPWTYQTVAVRVIDGDTVAAALDLGFGVGITETFRLRGINAAEHGTPAGDAATAWLTAYLAGAKSTLITTVRGTPSEKYGRYLAVLWADDVNVNDLAVALGYAVPYSGRGPKSIPPFPITPPGGT